MYRTRLKGRITPDRRLVVDVPRDVPSGDVDVILLQSSANELKEHRTRRKLNHPAFGIWAKRTGIEDSASYAAQLRQRMEKRMDGTRRD